MSSNCGSIYAICSSEWKRVGLLVPTHVAGARDRERRAVQCAVEIQFGGCGSGNFQVRYVQISRTIPVSAGVGLDLPE